MNFQKLIRQSHRWLGMALVLSVLAYFIAMAFGTPPAAIVYAPLLPLTLLMLSGTYMFFLPYAAARRERT